MTRIKARELDRYLEECRGLERDYLAELVQSKRAAWRVASAAGVLMALALVALLALLPLKRVEAFVVRVDDATGSVDVVTTLRDSQVSYGEAVDKYFVNKYVLARESYEYDTLQTGYDTTLLLSSPDVQRAYASLFEGPNALDKILGRETQIAVKVRSIALGTSGNTAVVRFVRERTQVNGAPAVVENLVATIGFRYVGAAMHEQDRLVNPLGFQVTSFRVDPEVVGGD